MSQFCMDHLDFESDSIDSLIVKMITNSSQLRANIYEQIFSCQESGSYIDALELLDAPLEFKLRVAMLFGDFDHAIKVFLPLFKRVYASIDDLNKKFEHEIALRFEQIKSNTNLQTYKNFLKYDESQFDSTEVSVCLLNQYFAYSKSCKKKFFLLLGYKHEESLEDQSCNTNSISIEQFAVCCGNELRLRIINALYKNDELTISQIAQLLDYPITTTIRHINQLRNYNLIFVSKRDGLQIFYKLNIKLFKKMQGKLNNLFDEMYTKKGGQTCENRKE